MRRLVALCLFSLFGLAAVAWAQSSLHPEWPPIQNVIIDKDTSGGSHVLRGAPGVHNEILGGYGNDTLYGGNAGDVIWTNYHPDYKSFDPTHTYCPSLGAYINLLTQKPTTPTDTQAVKAAWQQSNAQCRAQPSATGKPASAAPLHQVGYVYAGNGNNYIYATDTTNYVWTGTGRTVVHATVGKGAIHCQSAKVTVFISRKSRHRYQLPGCRHLSEFGRVVH